MTRDRNKIKENFYLHSKNYIVISRNKKRKY